ncbi:MAG: transposase, partial [Erysipelotrichaceae bacterium]
LNDLYHMMIDIDVKLKEAVEIKDIIHMYYRNTEHKNAKSDLEDIILLCRTSNTKELQDFSNTLCEWKQEIINSFIKIPSINRKMNNALIENRNKSIKLLKHSSNGYTNWNRFRSRVLYSLNDDIHMKL